MKNGSIPVWLTADQVATICMCLDYCIESHGEGVNLIFDEAKEVCSAKKLSERLFKMLRPGSLR